MSIRRIRSRIIAALLGVAIAAPAGAQVDTISPRPLFRLNDAYLATAFVLGTIGMHRFDQRTAERLQDSTTQTNRFFGDAATGFRLVAEPGAEIIGVGMYAVGRLAHVPRAADLGLHGTEAVLVGGAVAGVLKYAFGRARPYTDTSFNADNWKFGRGFKGADYQSFPSGHTVAAFAAAAAVTSETSHWWPSSRWVIGPALYGGATMVGLSRMYNNKHWASDVVLGAAIGIFAGNKVVRYQHSHPGNRLDRWLLSANVVPSGRRGYALAWSVLPR